jgi:hypothetical protein
MKNQALIVAFLSKKIKRACLYYCQTGRCSFSANQFLSGVDDFAVCPACRRHKPFSFAANLFPQSNTGKKVGRKKILNINNATTVMLLKNYY